MTDIQNVIEKAFLIIDGIAFETAINDEPKKILVTDLNNPIYRASFVMQQGEFTLSVSSFKRDEREQAMLDAVRINHALLIDEVRSA